MFTSLIDLIRVLGDKMSKRIMVVDDDQSFQREVSLLLDDEDHLEIVGTAATGEEALVTFETCQPDLVLMDIRMPGMSGLEATRWLKEQRPDIKVMALSMYEFEEYREEALNSGADEFMIKFRIISDLIPKIQSLFSNLVPVICL